VARRSHRQALVPVSIALLVCKSKRGRPWHGGRGDKQDAQGHN